jgi:ketosteroid isomerase-like protein
MISVVLMSLAVCTFARTQDAAVDTMNAAIQNVLTRQADSWNRGDLAGYMEGYWKSDSLLFTSGGRIQKGWEATLAKYRRTYSTKEMMGTLAFSSIEIHELSPGSAWVFGRWELTRHANPAGGVFTLVLRHISGDWKIVHDHTSVDPPPDPASVH